MLNLNISYIFFAGGSCSMCTPWIPAGCNYHGDWIPHGHYIPCVDGCNSCYCDNGNV